MTDGKVDRTTFDNSGPGGLRLQAGLVTNCIIRNNDGSDNSGGVEISGGLLTSSTIIDNRAWRGNNANAGRGGGIGVFGGIVRDCIVTNNQANANGGGIQQTGGLIEHCQITENISGFAGKTDRHGGGFYQTGGKARACTIADNTAYGIGGGAYLTGGALQSSLVVSNNASITAGNGHGIYLNGASARLENVTVADNSPDITGNGLYMLNGTVTNAIVYFNGTSDLNQTGGSIGYSCWSEAVADNGNINDNPAFLNRAEGNYRLSTLSPCINSGINYLWTPADRDLDGNQRIQFTICDMGAYESLYGNATLLILR